MRLDDVLKRSGLVGTGGEAKVLIQGGDVTVNGIVETRRRKQLKPGDVIEFFGYQVLVDDSAGIDEVPSQGGPSDDDMPEPA
ncbi:MAG: RNA-binding S4 domain-containing protein [Planctomycetota bacterium]